MVSLLVCRFIKSSDTMHKLHDYGYTGIKQQCGIYPQTWKFDDIFSQIIRYKLLSARHCIPLIQFCGMTKCAQTSFLVCNQTLFRNFSTNSDVLRTGSTCFWLKYVVIFHTLSLHVRVSHSSSLHWSESLSALIHVAFVLIFCWPDLHITWCSLAADSS